MRSERCLKKPEKKSQARTIRKAAQTKKNRQVIKKKTRLRRRKMRKTKVRRKTLMKWYTKDPN